MVLHCDESRSEFRGAQKSENLFPEFDPAAIGSVAICCKDHDPTAAACERSHPLLADQKRESGWPPACLFTPKPQIARVIPIPTQFGHACCRRRRAARNPEGKLRPVAARTMASSNSNSAAPAAADGGDDLDQLLDSALDDFTSLDLSASAAPKRYSLCPILVGVQSCSR